MANRRTTGFTLAEVAITVVIVGMTLLFVLQGVNISKRAAHNTYNRKVALQLALQTMAQIESGLFWDDIDDHMGPYTYAEEGYEDFSWEVAMGDESLSDLSEPEETLAFDSWKYRQQQEEDRDDEDDDDVASEPFEKVRIRVTFPKLGEYPNELVVERWIPWEQVYGPDEDDEDGGGRP